MSYNNDWEKRKGREYWNKLKLALLVIALAALLLFIDHIAKSV